jgi:hypothetical protein
LDDGQDAMQSSINIPVEFHHTPHENHNIWKGGLMAGRNTSEEDSTKVRITNQNE